jgi:arsenite-transporting ATPase
MAKLILFTGKGGVGKSTTSAATAYNWANKGYKTLLVSSDPAHSTEDVVGVAVGSEPVLISENFYAKNIYSEIRAKQFIGQMQEGIDKSIGKWFPGFDPELLTEWASFPGMDEVFALEELLYLVQSVDYDLIVFDTAPTGHTLKALTAPDSLNTFLLRILRMKARVEGLKTMFIKKGDTKKLVLLLEETIDKINRLKEILRNEDFVNINIVSIPTEAGYQECLKTCKFLKTQGFRVHNIVVNNIIPSFDDETWSLANKNKAVALLKMQHEGQKKYISLYNTFTKGEGINLVGVSKLPFEPRGENISNFSRLLWREGGAKFDLDFSKSIEVDEDSQKTTMRLVLPPSKDLKLFDDGYRIGSMRYYFGNLNIEYKKMKKKKTPKGATYTFEV